MTHRRWKRLSLSLAALCVALFVTSIFIPHLALSYVCAGVGLLVPACFLLAGLILFRNRNIYKPKE